MDPIKPHCQRGSDRDRWVVDGTQGEDRIDLVGNKIIGVLIALALGHTMYIILV